jgi:hypothetical protein
MSAKLLIAAGKNNHLNVTCPIWANELVQNLPSRRWSKKDRAWEVPIIRQNIDGIQSLAKMGGVEMSAEAESLIKNYEDSAVKAIEGRSTGMPHWYRFKTEPRKHQARGLNKVYGLNAAALFMEMQTGKSKTAIDLVACHRMEGHIHGVLVFSKLSLRKNWVIQFEQHCPIPVSIHLPYTDKERTFNNWMASDHDFKVMIVGWESLSAGRMYDFCERFMLNTLKSAIIGDESTYIAGHQAERSKKTVALGRMAEYRYALSGSPSLEGPMQLYMQYEFLDPNIIGIGDFYAFRNRYAVMGGYVPKEGPHRGKPTEIVGYQNLEELSGLIAPFTFEVTKNDAYDLPPKRYERRTVELSKEQRAVYKKVKSDKVLVIPGKEDKAIQNVLELALRLHQVTGGYGVNPREEVRFDAHGNPKPKIFYDPIELIAPAKNPKIMEVRAIVEETRRKKQGIIWAAYRPEIAAIVWALEAMGLKVGQLHGGVPEADRQPMVTEFQRGGIDWIVGNAGTGGMGYTIMASEVNIFYNNTFKAIDRVQAEDRAWGDGQTKSGVWIDVVAENTIDELVLKALGQKQDVSEFVRQNLKEAIRLLDGESS